MSSNEQGGKKRVETRNRKPPVIERPQAPASTAGKPDEHVRKRPLERKGGGNLYVGGARNEHGTRVARRVVCGRCGSEDHVPYVPKESGKAMCRDCAALVLRAYEVGTKVPVETRPETCNLCGTPFRIPLSVVDDGDPLCPNCLRGFMTWSGSIDTPFSERQGRVIENRGVGVVVRKKATRDGG
jgi:CxxC-x17-CxxC domain-containing protein